MNDILRLICIGVLLYSLLILWQRWEKWPPNSATGGATVSAGGEIRPDATDEDAPPVPTQTLSAGGEVRAIPAAAESGEVFTAETDQVLAAIDGGGGNLVSLRLKNHRDTEGADFALFEDGRRRHGAQSGLIGGDFPDHRASFTPLNSDANSRLGEGADLLTVALAAEGGGVRLIKRYIFGRGDDIIRLELEARNIGDSAVFPKGYFQLFHNGALSEQESSFLPSFFGAAVFTDAEKFQKIEYDEIGAEPFPQKSADGWIGFIQRYFAAVWLPEGDAEREYYMRARASGGDARIGVIVPFGEISPGAQKTISMRLFAGAQEQNVLNVLNEEKIAPGVHLVVDYGWLTFIAVPLFKLLAFIQTYAGNWGLSVILLTFLIKLAFYPLSSVSYRSIARMKELSPRIKNLQEIHGSDKQKLQQAMMALYREKKINPLGGCLPVLLQIPVFIALYWVILGSVELRHAPFYLWIDDLSASDPFFVLPLLMGAAMFLQTRMSPTPPDPTQALIIKIMPLFFTAFSLFFPAGLVLYWLVNTLLSIAQQWHISRAIGRAKGGG
ncbi:MAG: membrane protein insertase YidC [Gammaproteobacteria bacterium]